MGDRIGIRTSLIFRTFTGKTSHFWFETITVGCDHFFFFGLQQNWEHPFKISRFGTAAHFETAMEHA